MLFCILCSHLRGWCLRAVLCTLKFAWSFVLDTQAVCIAFIRMLQMVIFIAPHPHCKCCQLQYLFHVDLCLLVSSFESSP